MLLAYLQAECGANCLPRRRRPSVAETFRGWRGVIPYTRRCVEGSVVSAPPTVFHPAHSAMTSRDVRGVAYRPGVPLALCSIVLISSRAQERLPLYKALRPLVLCCFARERNVREGHDSRTAVYRLGDIGEFS